MRGVFKRLVGGDGRGGQRGQTVIFVVLGLTIVFLAVLGFAVDFGNLWFHRQSAQTAADAACTAAAMNMLDNAQGGNSGGFAWTPFNCDGNSAAPCKYINLNGYNGTGLRPNAVSSSASFTFQSPGDSRFPAVPACTSPPDPKYTMCVPPGDALGIGSKPVIQVSLIDRIKAPFFSLVSSRSTIDVPARSSCGVVLAIAPLPIVVLDPRTEDTPLIGSGIDVAFYGGPSRSIQVNGRGPDAVAVSGTGIDLSQGGPGSPPSGSDFGVTGNTLQPGILQFGTTGKYISPASPISDPFALVNAPGIPDFAPARDDEGSETVPQGFLGCPAATCAHYMPGYYPSGIHVNSVAIFDPGIYYVLNGFTSTACMRQSTAVGDGSGGTAFYFADHSSINIGSASSHPCVPSAAFSVSGGYPLGQGSTANGIRCTATSVLPSNVPVSINGTVLLAPCTGPDPSTGLCSPNCNLNAGHGLGDQVNSSDPAKVQRGILFFQNRSMQPSPQPSWQTGNDQFLLSGTLYFHQCTRSGLDTGVGCDTTGAFNDQFIFGGGSGLDTFFLGNIVADQLNLNGTKMTIDLNPSASYWILKASLLQ